MRTSSNLILQIYPSPFWWETLAAALSKMHMRKVIDLQIMMSTIRKTNVHYSPRERMPRHVPYNLTVCLVLIIRFNAASQKLHSSQSLVVNTTCHHETKYPWQKWVVCGGALGMHCRLPKIQSTQNSKVNMIDSSKKKNMQEKQ